MFNVELSFYVFTFKLDINGANLRNKLLIIYQNCLETLEINLKLTAPL